MVCVLEVVPHSHVWQMLLLLYTWTVTSGGTDDTCSYSLLRPTDTCGPGDMFMSSQTEDGGTNSSTLSVESVDSYVNETNVICDDGSTVIGNSTICIKFVYHTHFLKEDIAPGRSCLVL